MNSWIAVAIIVVGAILFSLFIFIPLVILALSLALRWWDFLDRKFRRWRL